MKVQLIILCLCLGLGMSACKKENADKLNRNVPTVVIQSPEEGDMFNHGDTVFIKATIEAKADLHGYMIKLSNAETEEELFHFHDHAHHKTLEVDTFWVNDVTTHSEVLVSVTGIGDHEGTETTETVQIHCMP